jgi:hypothetical protein
MNLQNYRLIFIVVVCILALLVASPALSRLLVFPRTEFFTGLWLLGPNHKAEDYPFNISRNQNYSVYLGIGNHLGYCAYYSVEVKFRNQTQSAPTSFGPLANRTPSSLPSLYNITVFVADEEVWEREVVFSFNYGFNETLLKVEFFNMTLNGVERDLRGLSTAWNASSNRFYGNLVFELWLFNASSSAFQYHERFVDLKLNMTVS